MQAAKLNKRLTLLRRREGEPDSFGEPADAWRAVGSVWAAYLPVSDGERAASAQTVAEVSARFHVRRTALTQSLQPDDRVRCEVLGQVLTFGIVGLKPVDGSAGIEISALARIGAP